MSSTNLVRWLKHSYLLTLSSNAQSLKKESKLGMGKKVLKTTGPYVLMGPLVRQDVGSDWSSPIWEWMIGEYAL